MKNEKQQTPPVMGVEIKLKKINEHEQRLKHDIAEHINQKE